MTALATASAVLSWAAGGSDHPPAGSLADARGLAAPDPEVLAGLQRLARYTAARLGAGRPPFGDDGRVGLGALLLAAAVGGRAEVQAAASITRAAPPLRLVDAGGAGWADAVARHGVAGRFAAGGRPGRADSHLVECLLEASPLTAILLRPPAELVRTAADGLLAAATLLMTRPHGREVLTRRLAAPSRDAGIAAWRARVVTELARRDRDAALGVYLVARLRHGGEWDELLDWAAAEFGLSKRPDGAAKAVLMFWVPLAVMADDDPDLLPSQRFLNGCHRAIELARRYQAMTTPSR